MAVSSNPTRPQPAISHIATADQSHDAPVRNVHYGACGACHVHARVSASHDPVHHAPRAERARDPAALGTGADERHHPQPRDVMGAACHLAR